MELLQELLDLCSKYDSLKESFEAKKSETEEFESALSQAQTQENERGAQIKQKLSSEANALATKCEELLDKMDLSIDVSKKPYEEIVSRDYDTEIRYYDTAVGTLRLMGKDYEVFSQKLSYGKTPLDYVSSIRLHCFYKLEKLLKLPKEEQFKVFKIQIVNYFRELSKSEIEYQECLKKIKSIKEELAMLPKENALSKIFSRKAIARRKELLAILEELQGSQLKLQREHDEFKANEADMKAVIAGDEATIQKLIDRDMEKYKNFLSLYEIYSVESKKHYESKKTEDEERTRVNKDILNLQQQAAERYSEECEDKKLLEKTKKELEVSYARCLNNPETLTALKSLDLSTLSEAQREMVQKLGDEIYEAIAKNMNS